MRNELHKQVEGQLCPEGNWKLSDTMNRILKRCVNCLPQGCPSEEETRYPTLPIGMRAFLDTFFARHFFQIQDSLIEYMTSDGFLGKLREGQLNILDIGCGPAVGSLAVTDLVMCIMKNLRTWNHGGMKSKVKVTYVLNDTSDICLGTGRVLLRNYLNLNRVRLENRVIGNLISIGAPFPSNLRQLKRIRDNVGNYDLIIMSYVVIPLDENFEGEQLLDAFGNIFHLCDSSGRVLIVQDQFRETLVRKVSKMIGERFEKRTLRQHVYSSENGNSCQTYKYFSCLCAPGGQTVSQKRVVA